jgi:hypothetical protein
VGRDHGPLRRPHPPPLHANPDYLWAGRFYWACIAVGFAINTAWLLRAARNFVTITLNRSSSAPKPVDETKLALPAWPYNRESFAVILGELQDRDGSRVPSERAPDVKPRWLILPELALYTGVFVTGGIGSGKTSAVAYPALLTRQPNLSIILITCFGGDWTPDKVKAAGPLELAPKPLTLAAFAAAAKRGVEAVADRRRAAGPS